MGLPVFSGKDGLRSLIMPLTDIRAAPTARLCGHDVATMSCDGSEPRENVGTVLQLHVGQDLMLSCR
jgi:hypothetical protein